MRTVKLAPDDIIKQHIKDYTMEVGYNRYYENKKKKELKKQSDAYKKKMKEYFEAQVHGED